MKWLSDTNRSLHTPNAAISQIFLKGPARSRRINTPTAQRSTSSSRTCPPLTPERATGRWPGFTEGQKSPPGSLTEETASPATSSRSKTPQVEAVAVGAADPGPPRRATGCRRSTVAATFSLRSPASPVTRVDHTTHEGKGRDRTTKHNPRRPRRALSWGAGAAARGGAGWRRAARCGADGAGDAARQMSAGGAGVSAAGRKPGGRERGGVGEAAGGKPGLRREGSGTGVPRRLGRPQPPRQRGTVPLLTRRETAGSAGAVPASGLRGQEAPPHSGREGRGRTTPLVRPPPPSPPASSAAETCAEPGAAATGAGGRAGGVVNGCSATGGERRGQIRRGAGDGGCHGRARWAEARTGEAAARRWRRLGSRLRPG